MNSLIRQLCYAMAFIFIAPITQSQTLIDKDNVLAQAEVMLNTEGKLAAANYLEQQYTKIDPLEDSIAVHNLALQYYYEMGEHESLRAMASRALASVDQKNESIWHTYSHAYGQLARYYVGIEKNPNAALLLLFICDEGKRSDLQAWCEHTRRYIYKEGKFAYRGLMSERVNDNAMSYWALLLMVFSSIGVFAFCLLRNSPSQRTT